MSLTVPTVTGYSTFWGGANVYAPLFARSSIERRASIALSRGGARALRAAMLALSGAAAGGTATSTHTRVDATGQGPTNAAMLGGSRTMETFTSINRATTAADETFTETYVITGLAAAAPSTYPTDASGNGGGGKVRF